MKIEIKFGTQLLHIDHFLDETATLGDLREKILNLTGVKQSDQKILGKAKLQASKDDVLLKSLGFKLGEGVTKLMLIGSTTAEQADAAKLGDSDSKKVNQEKEEIMRRISFDFWLSGNYSSFISDVFVAGRGHPLEGTDLVLNLVSLDQLLNRLNPFGPLYDTHNEPRAGPTYSEAVLAKFSQENQKPNASDEDLMLSQNLLAHIFNTNHLSAALRRAHGVVRRCFSFAITACRATGPEEVLEVVETCVARVAGLSPKEWFMVPCGWRGKSTENIFFLLITPEKGDLFKMIIVNRGKHGLQYHRSWQTPEKVKTCPLLVLQNVDKKKLVDKCFWLVLLSLWMRSNDPQNKSEYIREEVFYDVLLPWVIEKSNGKNFGLVNEDEVSANEEKTNDAGMSTVLIEGATFLSSRNKRTYGETQSSAGVKTCNITPSSSLTQNYASYLETCGCTTPRSESGTVKSLITAFCWLLDEFSGHQISASTMKQVKFVLKFETFLRAAEDLLLCGRLLVPTDPHSPIRENYVSVAPVDSNQERATECGGNKMSSGNVERDTKRFKWDLGQAIPTDFDSDTKEKSNDEKCRSDGWLDKKGLCVLREALGSLEQVGVRNVSRELLSLSDIVKAADREGIMLKRADDALMKPQQDFANKMVLVYVAGLKVPGVPQFSELLSKATPRLMNSTACSVEMLFISLDTDKESYDKHCGMFTFPRAKFPAIALAKDLEIVTVPELLLFSPQGYLLHRKGVDSLRADPELIHFPYGQCWSGAQRLSPTDRKMLASGASIVAHHTHKRVRRGELSSTEAEKVLQLLDAVTQVVASMPTDTVASLYHTTIEQEGEDAMLGATAKATEKFNPALHQSYLGSMALRSSIADPAAVKECEERNADLLPLAHKAMFLGSPYVPTVCVLRSIQHWKRASDYYSLHHLLQDVGQTVKSLWEKAKSSNTSSRVAEQMHIIEMITWTMVHLVPVPEGPPDGQHRLTGEEKSVTSSFYRLDIFNPHPPSLENEVENAGTSALGLIPPSNRGEPDIQFDILESLFYLTLSLANAWQAVEMPSRNFDAERCLVAMHILLVFDAVARHTCADSGKCHLLSALLNLDGGFYPSTSLGAHNVSFETLSSTFEVTRPELLPIRSGIIRYIAYISTSFSNELFDFLMPGGSHVEVSYGSESVRFLRSFISYAEISADSPGPTEMERLMEIFCGEHSPLVKKHPEFGLLRDIVFLTKFLGTMETRDAHLLHRRREYDRFASWSLSFEESRPGRQMSAGWRTKPQLPAWECMLIRGRDMNIADLRVKGFGDRELRYEEGLVVHSPINVGQLLSLGFPPTEDDLLHARELPTLGGALNDEEAETLLSYLTVPYLRIPLVLEFFATGDRNSHLFVKEVQTLVRATLFELGRYNLPGQCEWQSSKQLCNAQVPLQFEAGQDVMKMEAKKNLGAPFGLLVNELTHDPHATLMPLWELLRHCNCISTSSVYSIHVTYALFLIELVCDVLGFCRYTVQMSSASETTKKVIRQDTLPILHFLEETAYPWFGAWIAESEENDDVPTQCVLRNCQCMIDRALWGSGTVLGEPTGLISGSAPTGSSRLYLQRLLESCVFVRSHYGFGMGLQRSQLTMQTGDDHLSSEERLIRFFQAQGLSTSSISGEDALKLVERLMVGSGRRRAVFLQINSRTTRDTVRLPNVFRHAPQSTQDTKQLKLPPSDMAEQLVFSTLFDIHRAMWALLGSLSPSELSAMMQSVVGAALRQSQARPAPSSASPAGLNGGTSTSWVMEPKSDILVGPPFSGLVLYLQTGELFWRKQELKPVPDSMSHFTDYENIVGKELRQCGEVMRHQHRHWVHVLGTPFDLKEWTAPNTAENQAGIHCPTIIGGQWPKGIVESALWEGVVYDRIVAVGDGEGEQPWPVHCERWAVQLVRSILIATTNNLAVLPLAQERNSSEPEKEIAMMRFLFNDAPQHPFQPLERATWKEIVAYKYPAPYLEVYNLVPHARSMYRSLVYTSHQKFSLHSLVAIRSLIQNREEMKTFAFQAGDLWSRIRCESTLEINRYNEKLKGREAYIPPRLLQGVFPGALLEVFTFWQGEDNILRGYTSESEAVSLGGALTPTGPQPGKGAELSTDVFEPANSHADHWHRFSLEVFWEGERAYLVRRNDYHYTPIFDHLPHHHHRVASSVNTDTRFIGEEWERNVALLRAATRESHEVCAAVLRDKEGDVSHALQWAMQPKNAEELKRYREQSITEPVNLASDGGTHRAVHADPVCHPEGAFTEPSCMPHLRLRFHDQLLVNVRHSRRLHRLLLLLSGLEDASHILTWAHPIAKEEGTLASTENEEEEEAQELWTVHEPAMGGWLRIDSVDLPRLHARFVVAHEGGVSTAPLHLFLADYPGWRVAEPKDVSAQILKRLCDLSETFQQAIVLCNQVRELAVMVPNHSFMPLQVHLDPFNPFLVFDRSNFSWQQAVKSPFYLYTLHSSGSFIIPPTLSASLYLAALQCATQHYADAMTTLEGCYTDTRFTEEESFMCDLLQFTLGDRSPDALAVRLKMAHALQHSPNTYKWLQLHSELHPYLAAAMHVSSDCRLSSKEIIDLVKRCKETTPLLRMQVELEAAWVRNKRAAGVVSVPIKAPEILPLGLAWDRLLLLPWDRIAPQKLQRVTFVKPVKMDTPTGIIESLWKDTLLSDEESGSNARLGFLYLYLLQSGTLPAHIGSDEYHETFAALMTRWFHLRHSRWGREHQEANETTLGPSWCATVLQLMSRCPNAGWPAVDVSKESLALHRGIVLRQSLIQEGSSIDRFLMHQAGSHVPEIFKKIDQIASRYFKAAADGREDISENKHCLLGLRHYRAALNKAYQNFSGTRCTVNVPLRSVHSILVGRVQHRDTAQTEVEVTWWSEEGDLVGEPVQCSPATLAALCHQPLLELPEARAQVEYVELSGAQEDLKEGTALTSLPFDLSRHPLAQSLIAQGMLDRLKNDFKLYASQHADDSPSGTTHRGLSCLSQERIEIILNHSDSASVTTAFREADSALKEAISGLHQMRSEDQKRVSGLTQSILRLANQDHCRNAHPSQESGAATGVMPQAHPLDLGKEQKCHRLMRYHRDRGPLRVDWLCGGLLSTQLEEEVTSENPFHGSLTRLRSQIALLMLLSNRSHLAMEAVAALQQLRRFLQLCVLLRGVQDDIVDAVNVGEESPVRRNRRHRDGRGSLDLDTVRKQKTRELHTLFALEIIPNQLEELLERSGTAGSLPCLPENVCALLHSRLRHLSSSARDLLAAQRFYVHPTPCASQEEATTYRLDPRFLIMEFLFVILLRRRQVELTLWFVDELKQGRSRVQQMIMGQGKTSIVAPLLTLMLADGKQLVTQVMPTALVEQTRAVLRRCFAVVIVKHVFTLQFDRSCGDEATSRAWEVEALVSKLESAVADRAVVIAAPECLKSLFLKYIEQLHLLESTSVPVASIQDVRHRTMETRARERQLGRARLIDTIAPILKLWRDGVLLMDEVDVLLHPLRSELNFPIGEKEAIDLSGPRWTLPIHLLDLIACHPSSFTFSGSKERELPLLFAERDYTQQRTQRLEKRKRARRWAAVEEEEEENLSKRYRDVVEQFYVVLRRGVKQHALQREPHVVLLDSSFYEDEMLPLLITWVQLWVFQELHQGSQQQQNALYSEVWCSFDLMVELTTPFFACADIQSADALMREAESRANEECAPTPPYAVKLMHLAHDWLHRLLPHVLAKINRVSFGLLQAWDLQARQGGVVPLTRQLSAVPFCAKDVPSASSEFAHPDVAIGLTVLAFRYEGLRLNDVKRLMQTLKKEFTQQLGPKEQRPAALLYQGWIAQGLALLQRETPLSSSNAFAFSASAAEGEKPEDEEDITAVPLSQLQLSDKFQLRSLHRLLRCIPDVVYYYLSSHVFPRTMLFHRQKISACGHELGSSILFRRRLGFSGTPSSLLPIDLGECAYEAGSDARMLSVLTDPSVVRVETVEEDWTPLRMLDRIAAAQPPFYALIDAGALITNMTNIAVASYLLARLPAYLFDGVVFLDERDEPLVLQRFNGSTVPVAQSGIPASRRFIFFDQVHTTGTDLKQAASASAVITLGKDMTFRDYAQGAYRMRGIGNGQRLCVYLIPEVRTRMQKMLNLTPSAASRDREGAELHQMNFSTGELLRDLPAWLLLNSMKMDDMQFMKLSVQEMANVWRKVGYQRFLDDSMEALRHPEIYTAGRRMNMFSEPRLPIEGGAVGTASALPTLKELKDALEGFREAVGYPVRDSFEEVCSSALSLPQSTDACRNPASLTSEGRAIVEKVTHRFQFLAQQSEKAKEGNRTSNRAPDHDLTLNAEMVHEQEVEQEQEQEAEVEQERVASYSRDDEKPIPWSLSTIRQCGADEASTLQPSNGSCFYQVQRFSVHQQRQGAMLLKIDPRYLLSDNYFRLLWSGRGERRLKSALLFLEWVPESSSEEPPKKCFGLVSLIEAESLRWLIHQALLDPTSPLGLMLRERHVSLRFVSNGCCIAAADAHLSEVADDPAVASAALLYRFLNNDMFFTDEQLDVLEKQVLHSVPPAARLDFFRDCLQCRRRFTQTWEDTPVAILFFSPQDLPYQKQMTSYLRLQTQLERQILGRLMERTALQQQGKEVAAEMDERCASVEHRLELFAAALASCAPVPGDSEPNSHKKDSDFSLSYVAALLKTHFPSEIGRLNEYELERSLAYAYWRKNRGGNGCDEEANPEVHRALVEPCLSETQRAAGGTASTFCVTSQELFDLLPWLDTSFIQDQLNSYVAETFSSPSSAASEFSHQVPWNCAVCTLLNDATVAVCVACLTPRPSDAAGAEEVDSPWACGACTFLNSSRRQPVCSICFGPNPHALSDAGATSTRDAASSGLTPTVCEEGYWVCELEQGGCTKVNPNSEFYCTACEKGRPGLSHVRF